MDRFLLFSDGGCVPDGKDLLVDVSHLWSGRAFSAPVSYISAALCPLAESGVLCFCYFCRGVSVGLVPADSHRHLPMGLWGQAFFGRRVHPSGLRTPLGDIGASL